MKLAIMQPYFFPYIGYYQLAAAVEHFVFLDDVSFIKKGFIRRNSILLSGRVFEFSLSVKQASQNRTIREHWFSGEFEGFLKQLRHAYARAPFFNTVFPMIEEVCLGPQQNVACKAAYSIQAVFEYLGINLSSSFSSAHRGSGVSGEARIIELCSLYEADVYYNSIGGQKLYSKQRFADKGVELFFLKTRMPEYAQPIDFFVPRLSMIDVLMNVDKETVHRMLSEYDVVTV